MTGSGGGQPWQKFTRKLPLCPDDDEPSCDDVDPRVTRPRTRLDCEAGGMNEERPCPYVACRHHLASNVNENTGMLYIQIEWDEPVIGSNGQPQPRPTCALDEAEKHEGMTLEHIADIFGITRERARQIEEAGLTKLEKNKYSFRMAVLGEEKKVFTW